MLFPATCCLFGLAPGVDKDVIFVDNDEAIKKFPENLVHKVLEYRGGLANP